ncbi:MAG: glycoside hydrolase family 9 protein [Endomicrobiia bacterium]
MNSKKSILILFFSIVFSIIKAGDYNYVDAMAKTLMFFEANRCGKKVNIYNRFNWRGPCHIYDGIDIGEDLEGGYHDAGDHVIFGMPQTYSFSTLGWAYYETKDVYERTGQKVWMLRTLKYFSDFFMKCHRNPDIFYYQKGDGTIDHNYWGPPEIQTYDDYKIARAIKHKASSDTPAGDVAANAAAGMALMYLNYKDEDYNYAVDCLTHSLTLYRLARKYEGLGTGDGFYTHDTFEDDMSFAAVWLARASKDYGDQQIKQDFGSILNSIFEENVVDSTVTIYQRFLDDAKLYLRRKAGTQDPDDFQYEPFWPYCWGNIFMGSVLLYGLEVDSYLKSLGKSNPYLAQIRKVLGNYASGTSYFSKTPGGLTYPNTWGVLRYVSAAMFCFGVYLKYNPQEPNYQSWLQYIKSQIDYILGDNPRVTIDVDHPEGFSNPGSYIVGWGKNPPKHPHHRAAHGSRTNNMNQPRYHKHTLYGALVGGPNSNDVHNDVTTDYVLNEVAIDYNASAVAGLSIASYFWGNQQMPLPDPEPEPHPGDEIYITAVMGQDSGQRSQPAVYLYVDTNYPPQFVSDLSYKYFFDITEILKASSTYSHQNIKVETAYNPVSSATISSVLPYDISRNIYYVEVKYNQPLPFCITTPIFSPYAPYQFALVFQSPTWEEIWDSRNDYSRIALSTGSTAQEAVKTYRIPVYKNGVLIYGTEPARRFDPLDEPPRIFISRPYPNTTLSGNIYLEGSAVDDKGIENFVFYIHNPDTMQILYVSTITQYVQAHTTYTFNTFWDSKNYPNGVYLVRMLTTDTNGQTAVAIEWINIDHTFSSSQNSYPQVKIVFPENNTSIQNNFEVRANITDYTSVAYAELWINGIFVSSKTSSPYNWLINISSFVVGSTVSIKVVGVNILGLSSFDEIKIFISSSPLSEFIADIIFVSPSSGSVVSRQVEINVNIISSSTISKVEFYIDGILKFTDTISPYIYLWNTLEISNGSHTITVYAYDFYGRVSSKTISVEVLNIINDNPPQISILNLMNGETINADKTVTINVKDDKKIDKVKIKVGNKPEVEYDLSQENLKEVNINYTINLTFFLPNLSYIFQVYAVDSSSQSSYLNYYFSIATSSQETEDGGFKKIYVISNNKDHINEKIEFPFSVDLFEVFDSRGKKVSSQKNVLKWEPSKEIKSGFYSYVISHQSKTYKGIIIICR